MLHLLRQAIRLLQGQVRLAQDQRVNRATADRLTVDLRITVRAEAIATADQVRNRRLSLRRDRKLNLNKVVLRIIEADLHITAPPPTALQAVEVAVAEEVHQVDQLDHLDDNI